MNKIVCVIYLMMVVAASGLPAQDNLMLEVGEDTAVVESTVREARAAVPEHIEDLLKPGVKAAYLHTYGDHENDDSHVQGYRKRQQDKGNDGYRHFDSYHKKDADKYGYEINKEYGQENKHKIDVENGDEKSEKVQKEDEEEGEETKNTYKVAEDPHEGKKGVRALEDYDGGEGEHYTEGDGDSEHYESDGDSEHYEEGGGDGDGDGESAHYTSSEYDDGDGESGSYTATESEEDEY